MIKQKDNEELHLEKKKNGACVFLSTVFFQVFWRENSPYLNRCYLQNKLRARVLGPSILAENFLLNGVYHL